MTAHARHTAAPDVPSVWHSGGDELAARGHVIASSRTTDTVAIFVDTADGDAVGRLMLSLADAERIGACLLRSVAEQYARQRRAREFAERKRSA